MKAILRQERTEFGKRIRKTYELGEVKMKRMDMKVWMPRTDGISNTLTGVTKDNMLYEDLQDSSSEGTV